MPGFGTPRVSTLATKRPLGKLRQQVSVFKQTLQKDDEGVDVYDDNGQPVYTWQLVADKWPCAIETLAGAEVEKARQLQADATHRVWMRSNAAITEAMKIVFREREFFIGFISDVDQVGRFSWVLCAEKK